MPSKDAVLPVNTEQLSVIKRAKVSECLYKSLQSSTVEQNRSKLESLIKATKGNVKQRAIEGLIAVLDSLTVPAAYERTFTTSGRWKPFEQAFDLYSDFVYVGSREYVTLAQQRIKFKEDLLHPEHGLCVYVFQCQNMEFIILQNDQVELSGILK